MGTPSGCASPPGGHALQVGTPSWWARLHGGLEPRWARLRCARAPPVCVQMVQSPILRGHGPASATHTSRRRPDLYVRAEHSSGFRGSWCDRGPLGRRLCRCAGRACLRGAAARCGQWRLVRIFLDRRHGNVVVHSVLFAFSQCVMQIQAVLPPWRNSSAGSLSDGNQQKNDANASLQPEIRALLCGPSLTTAHPCSQSGVHAQNYCVPPCPHFFPGNLKRLLHNVVCKKVSNVIALCEPVRKARSFAAGASVLSFSPTMNRYVRVCNTKTSFCRRQRAEEA